MTARFKKLFVIALLLISGRERILAQVGLCPDNLDFEFGDFTNWTCRTGFVSVIGGLNTVTWTATGVVPGRHDIITPLNNGTDFYGGFPLLCPNGSGASCKLGNNGGGAQAEGISYTFTIPAAATSFSILYYYAIVLQDPSHSPEEQPRFRARLIDQSNNNPLPCVTFDFTASASLPGFRRSAQDPTVWFKDWTPISLNLSAYAGRTILLEFITSDCTRNGHFGYAYMDVSSVCNGIIQGSTLCPGETSTTLTAPFGFQGYTWYSDMTFTTVLSNSQTLTLTPPPAVGSIFPVVVDPYPGFGCRDTLYATITIATPPVSTAGPDQTICQGQPVQIGGLPAPGYTYSWTPAAEVSNPNIANPFATPLTTNTTEYIITTTDILTGCSSEDTTYVSTVQIDTTLTLDGRDNFCVGDPLPTLTVSNSVVAVQWYENSTGPIAGATGISYQPPSSGDFWAQVTQNGCVDSTRMVNIAVHPLPQPAFTISNDTGCVKLTTFQLTNTSTSPDNAAMTYVWKFSDGSRQVTTDASKMFPLTGTYTAKLIATTEFGCIDSTGTQSFLVLPGGVPDFSWDSVCVTRPVSFHNLSNENGSPQAYYSWDFNNGGPGSILKNPLPVVYNTKGTVDVTLKMTTLGCENDTATIVKTILVNKQAPGISYPVITVPEGSTRWVHVRDTVGPYYNWRPPIQLNSYGTRYTEFTAINDVTYFIDISDIHTCVTTDTMQILVLKKPGFYLPSAFTPNGDGLNDIVRPYLVGMKGLKSFSVFNRWGNLIFLSQTYGEGWDGKSRGVDQDAGVYVWILEFYNADNKLVTEKGVLTLIR